MEVARSLDLRALFLKVPGPQNDLIKIRYYTARLQPTPHDPNVNVRQDAYLRAVQAYCPLVELHYGHFFASQGGDGERLPTAE